MKTSHYLLLISLIGAITLGIIFSRNGILNIQTDTQVYVNQIRYTNHEIQATEDTEKRSFKPFYGIAGSYLTPVFTEHQAILFINILFYFGILIFSFFFLKELGFTEKFAIIGSAWIGTGYPLLKYGLALLTDISGWFFALATITIFLIGIRKNSNFILLLSSCIALVGSLCKETGVLGLFFAGLYLVLMFIYTRHKDYIKKIFIISLPFVILQALFLYNLFQKSDGGISFVQWYFYNKETFATIYHTFYYFFFIELSTFSILWLYSLYTLYSIFKKKISVTKQQYVLSISLLISTLPILMWPMFLTRVLYVGYLAIVPFSILGLSIWANNNKEKIKTFYLLSLLPIISSITLFIVASGGSLFDVLKQLF